MALSSQVQLYIVTKVFEHLTKKTTKYNVKAASYDTFTRYENIYRILPNKDALSNKGAPKIWMKPILS